MVMDTREKRKALQKEYKEREEVGCVSLYENLKNGRYLIIGEPNRHGAESRFRFSVATGSCARMEFAQDWEIYGPEAFAFSIMDTLKKGPEQTLKEFKDDLETLAEFYRAKRNLDKSY